MDKKHKLYRRAMKRKFSKHGISFIYGGTKYVPEDNKPFEKSEIDFKGVEVTVEKWGDEPGCFDMGTLFYVPTKTETKFLGISYPTFVKFHPIGENHD